MEYKARRRHVPAFGEWNYYCSPSSPDEPPEPARSGGGAAAAWWYCSPEPEARSDVWFRYSPPPRKPPAAPKKARRPEAMAAGKGGVVPAARAPAKASRRVVRPVDEDLYQVPPPEFVASSGRPRRKRAARSLWRGCLGGLGCIA